VSGRRTHYAGGAFLGLTVGALGHHIAGWSAVDVLAFGATAAATGGGATVIESGTPASLTGLLANWDA
jgi:hypothetical protein